MAADENLTICLAAALPHEWPCAIFHGSGCTPKEMLQQMKTNMCSTSGWMLQEEKHQNKI
jgi:hypothetical protein